MLYKLAESLSQAVQQSGAEIAHMKMTISPQGDPYEVAALSLVRGGEQAEFSHRLTEPLEDGEILLNMRAEASPDVLKNASITSLEEILALQLGLDYNISHLEHFRPGQPVPTYRVTAG